MKLFRIEWLKFKGHPFFWIGLGLYTLCMILLISKSGSIEWTVNQTGTTEGRKIVNLGEAGLYKLPYIWQNMTYMAGFFKFIPAFLLIFFVSNEFQYKTYRQNIIDGLSIREFYLSKLLSALIFSILSLLIIALNSLIIAVIYNREAGFAEFTPHADYLIAYFAEVLFLMVFALFLTFLFKRSTITVILILLYYFIIEPIAGLAIGEPVADYLPTRPSREMILQPFTRMLNVDSFLNIETPDTIPYRFLGLTFFYTLLLAAGGWFILKKRDI